LIFTLFADANVPRYNSRFAEEAGRRLDRFVSSHMQSFSNTRAELIGGGLWLLNGKPARIRTGFWLVTLVEVTPTPRPAMKAEAEQIPLTFFTKGRSDSR